MIVVTGAGGRLGGAVVEQLLDRLPPQEIGVSTTDPARQAGLTDRGVRVRRGDYDDPESLRDAFEGADRVLVVSAPRMGEAALAAHRAAFAAAQQTGVGRILYTSHVGSDPLSPFPPAVTHAATEVLLRDTGTPFTAVRNGFYADTPVRLLQRAVESGVLRAPVDAPVSWTVHEDLAPAIAALLTDPEPLEPVVTLTASEAVDLAALAGVAAEVTGRPVRHQVVGDDEYRDGMVAEGMPPFAAEMGLNILRASRQGRFGIVDPTLERLIGRPATRITDVVARALAG